MISEMSIKKFLGVTEKNNEECHMYNYCAVELGFSYFFNKSEKCYLFIQGSYTGGKS
jgi:hypothetical protein